MLRVLTPQPVRAEAARSMNEVFTEYGAAREIFLRVVHALF
jgi:hypothetical protein